MKGYINTILKNIIEVDQTIAVAAIPTHFEIYDFDFRRYLATKSLISATDLPLVLRIGAIDDYSKIYKELEQEGLRLINTIAQHELASLLPNWYPLIKNDTAKSKVYEEMPGAEVIMNDFEFPVFIKGERQTNKHQKKLCVAENKNDLEYILQSWRSDPILSWQGLICRQFIQLEKIDEGLPDRLPFSNEHRVFLWKNKVVAIGQYWTAAKQIVLSGNDKSAIIHLSEKIAGIMNIPFLVIDVGKQINGQWIVIELNDAQESGYAGVHKLQLWQAILDAEKANG